MAINLKNLKELNNLANEGISVASFCRQVAAWFPDMLCNFYLVKNHKIDKNLTTTEAREAREKNELRFGILRSSENF